MQNKLEQKVFFTSDLHFHHQNIMKFSPTFRPFNSVDEMNEYLIEYWNNTVGENDIVYNLGDFSFSPNLDRIVNILKRLNGEHHFILGNHDPIIEEKRVIFLNTKKADGKPLFSSIQDYKRVKLASGKMAMLFHYPIWEWQDCHKGAYMLHGHIHDRVADVGGKIINVGFDLHGKFLTEQDLDFYLASLPKKNHFGGENGYQPVADIEQNSRNLKVYLQPSNRKELY
ncbi:hypothetical protein A1D22_11245 [Pasteurellaceae bacterium LFhippo2]|nr:hypothetical protein [Pasteurellaceae bacterium LFhippo2]